MYIVVAKGSDAVQSLQDVRGLQEVTTSVEGERVFILRRDLKKD
jgi:20S proteasome subunit beta 6